jgi:hypothetical protein
MRTRQDRVWCLVSVPAAMVAAAHPRASAILRRRDVVRRGCRKGPLSGDDYLTGLAIDGSGVGAGGRCADMADTANAAPAAAKNAAVRDFVARIARLFSIVSLTK